MDNNKRNYKKELELIMSNLSDSIKGLSDEEIKTELREDGKDPDKIPDHMRNLFQSVHKKYRKRLLLAAKEEHKRQFVRIREKKFNFSVSLEEKRKQLMDILTKMPNLQSAFTFQNRNFKDLSDEEVELALKQLIELGVIKEDLLGSPDNE